MIDINFYSYKPQPLTLYPARGPDEGSRTRSAEEQLGGPSYIIDSTTPPCNAAEAAILSVDDVVSTESSSDLLPKQPDPLLSWYQLSLFYHRNSKLPSLTLPLSPLTHSLSLPHPPSPASLTLPPSIPTDLLPLPPSPSPSLPHSPSLHPY